jgi:hypothetical protein
MEDFQIGVIGQSVHPVVAVDQRVDRDLVPIHLLSTVGSLVVVSALHTAYVTFVNVLLMGDSQNGDSGQLAQLHVVVDCQLDDDCVPIQFLCMVVKIVLVRIMNQKCARKFLVQLMVALVHGVYGLSVLYHVVEG